jgi:hypothetical protein
MNKTAAALVILLAVDPARCASPQAPKLGEGAQRLVGGAVKFAKIHLGPNLCLEGVDVSISEKSQFYPPSGPQDAYYNTLYFAFGVDDVGVGPVVKGYELDIVESIGTRNPRIIYDEYRPVRSGMPGLTYVYGKHCITEMSVDSGDALAFAHDNGLVMSANQAYHAYLRRADNDPTYFDSQLFGKTYWIVGAQKGDRDYFIDAKTGKLLLRKKV